MTIYELQELAEPQGFRPFVVITFSGAAFEVPHPEFIDIPPGEETPYFIVYRPNRHNPRVTVPQWVDLDAIDHIDFDLP